jgi:asparagine synthase (glutamine-hydrolysing)
MKLRGLTEKFLLKKLGSKWLPAEIWRRPKRPYRAPIQHSFFNKAAQGYVRELLSPEHIRKSGLFNPAPVTQLLLKAEQGSPLGETGNMALVGIISTQLVHHLFIERFSMPPPLSSGDPVKIEVGPNSQSSP